MAHSLYTLQINCISACFEIKVNDIPLYAERKGKPTSVELPLNHFLLSGKNQFKIIISPAKHEIEFQKHSQTDFELFVRDIDDLRENRVSMAVAEFPDYKNDESLKSSTLSTSKDFQVSGSFYPKWVSCSVLTLNGSLIRDVNSIYRSYFNLLNQRDIGKILQLTGIKVNDYADAYYLSKEEQQQKIEESLMEVFEEKSYILIDFDKQATTPQLHGFGKVVSLINVDNRSPLQFFNMETRITKSYPIYLGSVSGKLEIVL